MKRIFTILAVLVMLLFLLPACVKTTVSTPTLQYSVVNTPAPSPGELAITSTNAFVDSNGIYRIFGLIINDSNTAMNSIELTITIKDISGTSLLEDDAGNITPNVIFYPMLYTLAPGESSPFEYGYDTTGGMPSSYQVEISGQQSTTTNRAALLWEQVQIMEDGTGRFYLTGQIFNTSNQWTHINSLTGGVLDDSGALLSAGITNTYVKELAPSGDSLGRDRTPFEIHFPNPGGSTQWALYWDADTIETVTDIPLGIDVSNFYFDQFGFAHLVGWVTNNSVQAVDTLLVGGLYADDGTVLDAGYAFIPISVEAGSQAPFSISSFESVNENPNQAAMVSSNSIQNDLWFTTPPTHETLTLQASQENLQKDGAVWTISGNVVNDSEKTLSGITVVGIVKDAQGKLVATQYTSIFPSGDVIDAGESNDYSLTIYLPPAIDYWGLAANTIIVGIVQ